MVVCRLKFKLPYFASLVESQNWRSVPLDNMSESSIQDTAAILAEYTLQILLK
jgi:hypothetical protein